MTEIALEGVTKAYEPGSPVIEDLSLTIESGEFMVLVGPSGCGKSTLLRMVAGLEEVTSGRISIGGRDVTEVLPRHRDIAMVFQSYALYPHMSVRKNLGYSLRVRRTPRTEIDRRVTAVAELLGLSDLLERKPAELSGGQRQRVAMGRAMVREPAAFLMDEPLSNLDAKLRVAMRSELARLHARLGTTTVYVTHDQVEAMTLGQRVTVLRDGTVQQVGSPKQLYAAPDNVFVAGFIGSPAMNLVEARVEGTRAIAGEVDLDLEGYGAALPQGDVILGIRPHAIEDARFAEAGLPSFEVEVGVVEDLGSETHVLFWLDARRVDPMLVGRRDAPAGDERLFGGDDRSILTAVVDPRAGGVPGGRIRLAIHPRSLYFFDPETGARLG